MRIAKILSHFDIFIVRMLKSYPRWFRVPTFPCFIDLRSRGFFSLAVAMGTFPCLIDCLMRFGGILIDWLRFWGIFQPSFLSADRNVITVDTFPCLIDWHFGWIYFQLGWTVRRRRWGASWRSTPPSRTGWSSATAAQPRTGTARRGWGHLLLSKNR